MKIVIAPDSFKESLSAIEAAEQIEAGFREVLPDAEYVKVPFADGGEGTVQAIIDATGGRIVTLSVTGPLGDPVEAFYGVTGDGETAVIEMATASGLGLVPPSRRDPLATTTFGVGEMIHAALDGGARRLIVGIGGSATNDGGAGMAQALGARLLDAAGDEIGRGGGSLAALVTIDASRCDPRLCGLSVEVACDVDSPLLGPRGASAVFGPQKGATPAMVGQLDRNLSRFAACIRDALEIDVTTLPGGGAAGGLGAGLVAFTGARLCPGVEIVADAVGLDAIIADADLVITGEGRIDSQSIHGKTPIGVAAIARRHGVPVIGIAGALSVDADVVHGHGIDAVFSVLRICCTVEQAYAEAAANLRVAARNIAAVIGIGMAID